MSRELIAGDVAAFHGWSGFDAGPGLNAYVHVAEAALEREFHRMGVDAYLEYLDGRPA